MGSLSIQIIGIVNLVIQMLLLNTAARMDHLPQRIVDMIKKDINGINGRQTQWTADFNYFLYMKKDYILPRVGSNTPPSKLATINEPKVSLEKGKVNKDKPIPESFDARKNWPHCAKVIGNVYDQSYCESNWAVAPAAAFSSRYCIASYENDNQKTFMLSAEDLMTCCDNCKDGGKNSDSCHGGYVDEAWTFINQYGLVTGGIYGSQDSCKPYSIAPCPSSPFGECSEERPRGCQTKCTNHQYSINDYRSDKIYGEKPYYLDNHEDVQRDIMTYGPLTASFRFSDDFPYYKKGIFTHVYGSLEKRYHTAVLIGWGKENGIDYWLAINTWNSSWGEDGTVRIDRTHNNCQFGFFMASVPKVN
ncbi:hypothetical protein V9T40_010713 [Parthenolecanium corni]|uniref:Peptidase C1A papain C-terminal domain-containing protein n=1 Tax=Parthenolecanium corni TaxID=536013 RepID=A0AAN9XXR6_9HEMI